MRNIIRLAVVVSIVASAGWYGWRWLFPSDEAAIHGVLERIAGGVEGGGPESATSRLARAAALRREFDPDVTVDAGPPFNRLSGRDAIIGTMARLNGSVRNLDVDFSEVTIHIDPDRDGATAHLIAEARFEDVDGGGFDARELDVTFTRTDGAWVVSAVTLVQPLRRLDQR